MNCKRKILALGCLLTLVLFMGSVAIADDVEPKVGQQVNYNFGKPMSDEDAKYLGLAKAEPFALQDVKAPYVFVEQFNTSCPHCMAQAPVLMTVQYEACSFCAARSVMYWRS